LPYHLSSIIFGYLGELYIFGSYRKEAVYIRESRLRTGFEGARVFTAAFDPGYASGSSQ
jgi:hypothetical protein